MALGTWLACRSDRSNPSGLCSLLPEALGAKAKPNPHAAHPACCTPLLSNLQNNSRLIVFAVLTILCTKGRAGLEDAHGGAGRLFHGITLTSREAQCIPYTRMNVFVHSKNTPSCSGDPTSFALPSLCPASPPVFHDLVPAPTPRQAAQPLSMPRVHRSRHNPRAKELLPRS
jgi:hypothetical protein